MPTENPVEAIEVRRKRLRFRSWHRGTRETDLIMGHFADRHLAEFSEEQLDRWEELLDVQDPDIYNWVIGRESVPPEYDSPVMDLLVEFTRNSKKKR